MEATRFELAARIFGEACRRPRSAQADYVRDACDGDDELRAEIEGLLSVDRGASGVLADAATGRTASEYRSVDAADPTPRPEADPNLGRRIARFRLESVIGSGGMGTVYLAVQEQPHRRVAVKLMRPGIASASALRRFEFEAQLLGRLRHPGIAQVHEAGTHDDGSGCVPYFAMEYVPGARTITAFADDTKLDTRQRLALFAKVCDAVHHGHQKGIVHRDLKPSNLLVDSSGQPKIIDFGVARAGDSDLVVTTLQTNRGELVGTLQYMSPEQCAADPHDLDTRSDVYALGVVLYELLVGRLPYDVSRTPLPEVVRRIQHAPPVRPGTVDPSLRGDVETILLKTLEKDRERRYRSAAELGDDIHRYLDRQPIAARPISVAYQLRMFARRNRSLVAALAAVALVLASASIAVGVFAADARREAIRSGQASAYLANLLSSADPSFETPPTLELRTMLAAARDAFGDDHVAVATSLTSLASLLHADGNPEAAEPFYREAVTMWRELGETRRTARTLGRLGELHYDVGSYAAAEQELLEAIALHRRAFDPDSDALVRPLNSLVMLYITTGRDDRAAPHYAELVDRVRRAYGMTRVTAGHLSNYANWLAGTDEPDAVSRAVEILEQASRIHRAMGDEDSREAIRTQCARGSLLRARGDDDAAKPLLEDALARGRRHLDDRDRLLTKAMSDLVNIYTSEHDEQRATALYGEYVEIRTRRFGPDSPAAAETLHRYGLWLTRWGNDEAAIGPLREALAVLRRSADLDHPAVTAVARDLAEVSRRLGEPGGAGPAP